jgi:quinol-cytochrome oxidoreductase complex cytochrome b subunit
MLWLLWFAFLFIIAVPETDQWLQNSSERLKKIAQKIIIVVLVIGIVEFIGLSIIGLDTLGLKEKEQ